MLKSFHCDYLHAVVTTAASAAAITDPLSVITHEVVDFGASHIRLTVVELSGPSVHSVAMNVSSLSDVTLGASSMSETIIASYAVVRASSGDATDGVINGENPLFASAAMIASFDFAHAHFLNYSDDAIACGFATVGASTCYSKPNCVVHCF